MRGTFFQRPLEWTVETKGESWAQGDTISGVLTVKNHGNDPVSLQGSGVLLALGDIKKVHSRNKDALSTETSALFTDQILAGNESIEWPFQLMLPPNCMITDKKVSYYLSFGKDAKESHLQVSVTPKKIFLKIAELLENFYRFKPKEVRASKRGVEFKMIPPTSREMANIENLCLTMSVEGEGLKLDFLYQVKKIDMKSVTTKITKDTVSVSKTLLPKEYSLGKDMINQTGILAALEAGINEAKLKEVY